MRPNEFRARILVAMSLATLMLAGCNKEPAPTPEPGERMAVHFLLPGIEGQPVVAAAPKGLRTRAALSRYVTVRIVAYRHGSGTPSADSYVTEQTYVADAAGALTPCTVNTAGDYVADNASAALMLPGGTYDFYAITPALPLSSDHTSVSVSHGVDYATSVTDNGGTGFSLSLSDLPAKSITLKTLQRQCAMIELVVTRDASYTAMTALSVNPDGSGVRLSSLSTAPMSAVVGAALVPTPNPSAVSSFTLAPTAFTQTNTTTASGMVYVLPKVAADLGLSFDLQYTLSGTVTTKSISGKVSGIVLDAGGSYRFTLTLSAPGATLTVTDWVDGGTQDNDMGA